MQSPEAKIHKTWSRFASFMILFGDLVIQMPQNSSVK
jgi:hypothetical protein